MARTIKAAGEPKEPEDTRALRFAVTALEQRVEALEANRPGRKAKPLVALRQDDVCAVSPDIDSSKCPDSSIFRYQQGCHGKACKAKQHAAYERRKSAKAEQETPVTVKKAPAKPAGKTNGVKKTTARKAPAARKKLASVG